MLFTTINKTKKRNVYIYMYMFYNKIDKWEKEEEQKTGGKIRSAGLLYSYVCLTNKNGVIANEDKKRREDKDQIH